ncbi:MAG: protein translocase SEC61 complex subunit gamma [Candidatus Micrarchaeota archaeon]
MIEKINSFIQRSMRVLRVSYRPKSQEYWMIAKVTGLGMALIGLVGFLITIIFNYVNMAT